MLNKVMALYRSTERPVSGSEMRLKGLAMQHLVDHI